VHQTVYCSVQNSDHSNAFRHCGAVISVCQTVLVLNALRAFRRRVCNNGNRMPFTRRTDIHVHKSVSEVRSHVLCTG
jgi:hypothetical protein